MREIKFRAWDKEEKKIMNVNLIRYVSHLKGIQYIDCWREENGEIIHKSLTKGNFELLQFTGLKDKNGKEIYEGNILKIFDENCEVKFIQTASSLRLNYGYPQKHNGPAPHWVEIIGNKFENPELLK